MIACADSAAERARRGKSPRAAIKLAVEQLSGNKVRLTVSDDGAGIDTAKVKASAVQRGRRVGVPGRSE